MRDYGDYSDYCQDTAYAEEQSFRDALAGQGEYENSLLVSQNGGLTFEYAQPLEKPEEATQAIFGYLSPQARHEDEDNMEADEADTIILPYTNWENPPYDGPEDDDEEDDDSLNDDDPYDDDEDNDEEDEYVPPHEDEEEIPF